MEFRIIKHWI